MKTLRFFGTALIATLMCVACSNEEIVPEEQEAKYVTVDLGVTGEYLKVSESPLDTRAENIKRDVITISVYSNGELYAIGKFLDLDDVKIKLLEGKVYKFIATVEINGCSCSEEDLKIGHVTCCNYIGKTFHYAPFSNFSGGHPSGGRIGDIYYGEIENYSPAEDGIVEIATKRVVYGAHFIAEGLTEGRLDILVNNLYSVQLTPENYENEGVYVFSCLENAWKGIDIWHPDEFGNPGHCTTVNYYIGKSLLILWTKDDGSETPLGTFDVTFKRNIKTTIVIKVEDPSQQNGIVVTKEETRMTEDENKYVIEGGTITEVPVTSQQ